MSADLKGRFFPASVPKAWFSGIFSTAATVRARFGIALPRPMVLIETAGVIVVAALVAGTVVVLSPSSVDPASAAVSAPGQPQDQTLSVSPTLPLAVTAAVPAHCETRSWPYIDQRCLAAGSARALRAVRLVNTDGIAATVIVTPQPRLRATPAQTAASKATKKQSR